MNKKFKILTIDGGGIKGLYSATILNKIEKQLIKETGDENTRIVEYFDLICGTSTGGLIALALSLGISTDKICDFYVEKGPEIFRWPNSKFRFLRQTLFFGKYSNKRLRNAIVGILGENKISNSKCLLCIPTFDITHGTYEIFKFDHKEGNLSRDNDLPMVDVALATSAAPTYFPAMEIPLHDNRQYVDGGVWANNPSIIGYTEAIRHFVGEDKLYQEIELLSISSLTKGKKTLPLSRKKRSFWGWKSRLFEMPLIGQSEFAHILLNSINSSSIYPMKYYRIPSSFIDASHDKHIDLDIAGKKSIVLMKQFGSDKYHQVKEDINPFFLEKKSYDTNEI